MKQVNNNTQDSINVGLGVFNFGVKGNVKTNLAFAAIICLGAYYVKKKIDDKSWLKRKQLGSESKSDTNNDNINVDTEQWKDSNCVSSSSNGVVYYPNTPIRVGDICMIYSAPKMGKSLLVNQFLFTIASGKGFGFFTNEIDCCNETTPNVFLYDIEQDDDDWESRYGNRNLPTIQRKRGFNLNDFNSLAQDIKRTTMGTVGDCVFAIDNIHAISTSDSVDSKAVDKFFTQLVSIQREAKQHGKNITFIIVNHTTKDGNMESGASNWRRFCRSIFCLDSCDFDNNCRVVRATTRDKAPFNDLVVRLVDTEETFPHFVCDEQYNETDLTTLSEEEKVKRSIKMKENKMSADTIASKFGLSRSSLYRLWGKYGYTFTKQSEE